MLTLIGVILLPLTKGFQQSFTVAPVESAPQAGLLESIQEGLPVLARGLMMTVPAALCMVSVIMLAAGLTLLFRERHRK